MRKLVAITLLIFLISLSAVYAETYTASIDLPAVQADGTGVLSKLEVEVIPGKGRVLLTINPLTGLQTQSSEIIAVSIAKKYTDFNFSNYDVIFTIDAGGASVVEGPSAGAAMAVAVIAAVEEKEIREDAGITGTIQPDGRIGHVGGIFEKAEAAAQGGDKIFLIPEGDSIQATLVEKVEEPAPGWIIRRIVTEYIDISKKVEEEYDIKLIEVSTIKEAVDILLNGEVIIKEPGAGEAEEITDLEEQQISDLVKPMSYLTDWEINTAEKLREEAKEKLANPTLDMAKSEMLQSMFSSVDQEILKAKRTNRSGYLYGAANYAFKAGINAKYVRDLATYYVLDEREQMTFVGDRITETAEKLKSVKQEMLAKKSLVADSGAYEWAIAAQERMTQAELQIEKKTETSEGVLYSLATVEGWLDIAHNLINRAQERATGELLGLTSYENKSSSAITRAEAELKQLGEERGYGAEWFLEVAKKEQENEQFVTAYIDARIASSRLETMAELNTRGWSDLVSYIEAELDGVDVHLSAWAKLYRDYGKLMLYHAKTELDVPKLKDALIYARQAELFSELSAEYAELPEASLFRYSWVAEKKVTIVTTILIVIVLFFIMSKSLHKSFSRGRKNNGQKALTRLDTSFKKELTVKKKIHPGLRGSAGPGHRKKSQKLTANNQKKKKK